MQCTPGFTLSGVNNPLVADGLAVLNCHLVDDGNGNEVWDVSINAVVYKLMYHPKKLCAKLQICGTQVLNQGLGPDCHVLPFYKLICNLIRGDAQMTSALGGSGGGVTQNLTEGRRLRRFATD